MTKKFSILRSLLAAALVVGALVQPVAAESKPAEGAVEQIVLDSVGAYQTFRLQINGTKEAIGSFEKRFPRQSLFLYCSSLDAAVLKPLTREELYGAFGVVPDKEHSMLYNVSRLELYGRPEGTGAAVQLTGEDLKGLKLHLDIENSLYQTHAQTRVVGLVKPVKDGKPIVEKLLVEPAPADQAKQDKLHFSLDVPELGYFLYGNYLESKYNEFDAIFPDPLARISLVGHILMSDWNAKLKADGTNSFLTVQDTKLTPTAEQLKQLDFKQTPNTKITAKFASLALEFPIPGSQTFSPTEYKTLSWKLELAGSARTVDKRVAMLDGDKLVDLPVVYNRPRDVYQVKLPDVTKTYLLASQDWESFDTKLDLPPVELNPERSVKLELTGTAAMKEELGKKYKLDTLRLEATPIRLIDKKKYVESVQHYEYKGEDVLKLLSTSTYHFALQAVPVSGGSEPVTLPAAETAGFEKSLRFTLEPAANGISVINHNNDFGEVTEKWLAEGAMPDPEHSFTAKSMSLGDWTVIVRHDQPVSDAPAEQLDLAIPTYKPEGAAAGAVASEAPKAEPSVSAASSASGSGSGKGAVAVVVVVVALVAVAAGVVLRKKKKS